MEYKIEYDDLFVLTNQLSSYKQSLDDTFEQLKQALAELGQASGFKGKTAKALADFINEVHLSMIIPALSQSILHMEMNLSIYYLDYIDADPDIHTIVQQETLEDTAVKYDGHLSHFLETYEEAIQVTNGISDIISVSVPASTSVEQTITGITDFVRQVDEDVQGIESKYYTQFRDIYDLLSSIYDLMKKYEQYDADAVAGYQSGDCLTGIEFEKLKEDIIASCQYTTSEEVQNKYADSLEVRQETYNKLVEERKEDAIKNIISSAVDAACIVGGIAVIFLSGGTATPVVIASGSAKLLYDGSNICEGINSYQLAQAGDIYTVAFNPIRDSVFMGHQDMYDIWGSVNGTVFSASMVMAYGGLNANTIKSIAGDYAKDKAFELAGSVLYEEYQSVTGEELSGTQKALIQGTYDLMGMSHDVRTAYAGYKAANRSPNLEIRKPEMTEEDLRYEEYWKKLETGQNTGHPGMTEADIIAWEYADAKVNEHIVMDKINSDEVIKLRVENTVKDIESGRKTAKEIISDRVQGLDLEAHPTSNKQLSSSKMKELKNKIDSRTATREEYNLYEWNKKMSQRRSEGVKDFWNQERERIISGEGTTRNWSQEQIADILSGKTPKYNGKPIQGHHAYSVSQYPHLANKGEVIYPVTLNEHLNGWHGGNFRNSLPGEPIVDIHDFD